MPSDDSQAGEVVVSQPDADVGDGVETVCFESDDVGPYEIGTLMAHVPPDCTVVLDSPVDWLPDMPTRFEPVGHRAVDRAVRELLSAYAQLDLDKDREAMRELMTKSEALTDTVLKDDETVEELNELFWEWFQELPDEETISTTLNPLLQDVLIEYWSLALPDENELDAGPDRSSDDDSGDVEGASDSDESHSPGENGSSPGPGEPEESGGSDGGEEGGKIEHDIDVQREIIEDFLDEAREQLTLLENQMVELENNPADDTLDSLYRAMHTLKGGFGFCNLDFCETVVHRAEDLLGEIKEAPDEYVTKSRIDLLLAVVDLCRQTVNTLEEAEDTLTLDVSATYPEVLGNDLERAAQDPQADTFDSLDLDEGADDTTSMSDQIKLDLSKVEQMVNLVEELVISQTELLKTLSGSLNSEGRQAFKNHKKIISELQQQAMDMRMLPLQEEFQKYPRIVRDLADELDKKINLTIQGERTELDKSVLSQLEEPLMHLVRNAVDHGLETPEVRRQNGKSEEGQLHLRAYHESGYVYIEIEDDGAGLSTGDIEQKAIEQGLIESDHDLTDDEIHQKILEPGFSTADEVSDVSGRGVGLDAVAQQIDNLHGNLLIDSEPGKGTTFTLELPLTVAIIDGLVVEIGDERFIIPAKQVEESINPDPGRINAVQGEGRVVQFRDRTVPVVDPGRFLSLTDPKEDVQTETIMVVISVRNELFAIWVDGLIGHDQIVVKQVESPAMKDADMVTGASILGDGEVGLILDTMELIRTYNNEEDDEL